MNHRINVRAESSYDQDVEIDIIVDDDALARCARFILDAEHYDPEYFTFTAEPTDEPVTVCNARTAEALVRMVFAQADDYRRF